MSIGIVKQLKLINIDQDHRDRCGVSEGPSPLQLKKLFKVSPIRNPGQGIGCRKGLKELKLMIRLPQLNLAYIDLGFQVLIQCL